jgi:hypothetical protein
MAHNNDMFAEIIEEIRKVSRTTVNIDNIVTDTNKEISISRTRLVEILQGYDEVHVLVNKCWSNFPPAPYTKKTYVFVSMMMCKDYDVNHNTIKWEDSTPNIYIHLWSIMDRIKIALDNAEMQ